MKIKFQGGGIWDGVEIEANSTPAEIQIRSFPDHAPGGTLDLTGTDIYVLADDDDERDDQTVYQKWPGDRSPLDV